MEVTTKTPEGAEFMKDILSGFQSDIANYIEKVGVTKACENIYKLAEYANDLTERIEDYADNSETIAELQADVRALKNKQTLHDYYRDGFHKAEKQIASLKATIKVMSEVITE